MPYEPGNLDLLGKSPNETYFSDIYWAMTKGKPFETRAPN